MPGDRYLLDTFFALALLSSRDRHHSEAKALLPTVHGATEIWVTEAVLTEIGNFLSAMDDTREKASTFIESCYALPNFRVVPVDSALFSEARAMYKRYADKAWGLTDCISFVVMERQGLSAALTGDRHFEQAGYTRVIRTLYSG